MDGFVGFFELGTNLTLLHQSKDVDNIPTTSVALPTYRIYLPAGTTVMTNGTGTTAAFDSASNVHMYKVTHLLSAADGYEVGKCYHCRVTHSVGANVRVGNYTFIVT